MKTILLTDDDPELIDLLYARLADTEYRLITANDGKEAVQICLDDPPDLVLMDIEMPNMNGLEATQTLRSKGFTNPIIILTASESEADRKAADEIGCNGYLLKTPDLDNIKNLINMTFLHYLQF